MQKAREKENEKKERKKRSNLTAVSARFVTAAEPMFTKLILCYSSSAYVCWYVKLSQKAK